jgi:hypothetical protein
LLLKAAVCIAASMSAMLLLLAPPSVTLPAQRPSSPQTRSASAGSVTLAQLLVVLHEKAHALEDTSGMRLAFQSFADAHNLPPDSIRYSDFVMARLLFEATRDAGFWNLHWNITDRPPNSDRIWQQWQNVGRPSVLKPTATAECDELSALYAFLAERTGLRTVGLLWPYSNHTVAVWVLRPKTGPAIRVVVPTSQIFLQESDTFDTRTFDPWRQKNIYEYTRRDVSDSFVIARPLFDFFVQQIDKYAGASTAILQRLRYLREAVFLRARTPEQAAQDTLKRRSALTSGPAEDQAALYNFALDMRSEPFL